METNRERMLRILEDTVKYYSEDTSRRSLNEHGGCVYISDDGRRCGVGRYLKDEGVIKEGYNYLGVYVLLSEHPGCLKESGLPTLFWEGIQDLHDSNSFWNREGLTAEGERAVEGVKTEILRVI